jgi:hypothetical protein
MKMKRNTMLTVVNLVLGALCSPMAGAQEVLPFPPTPSASTAGLTMKDSTYNKRVEPRFLAVRVRFY